MKDLLDYPDAGIDRLEADVSACGRCGADLNSHRYELTGMTGRLIREQTTLVQFEWMVEVFCSAECADAWLTDTGISIESPGAVDIGRCMSCGAAVNRHAVHGSVWLLEFAGQDVVSEQCLGILCNDCVTNGGPDGDGGIPLPIAA